jgi:hypothetical protein
MSLAFADPDVCASRLTEMAPTRLFIDAHGAAEWRAKSFHSVLPGDPGDAGAGEKDRRVREEDRLSVVRGFLGAYPNALFQVRREELDAFVEAVSRLDGDASYAALRARFGVLRASDGFWSFSDRINDAYRAQAPRESGLFDFNRLDAL